MLELAKMHPMGRYATVDEVTGAAVYLTSDEARFVTGIILPIDGGFNYGLGGPKGLTDGNKNACCSLRRARGG